MDTGSRMLDRQELLRADKAGEQYRLAPDARYPGSLASIGTLDVEGVEMPWRASGDLGARRSAVLLAGLGWRATGCVLSGYTGGDDLLVGLDYPRRWPRRRLDSIQALAALFARAIEALEVGPVRLTGVSTGGMIALQLALDRPELVESLALASTAASGSWVVGRWRVPLSRATAVSLPPQAFYRFYRRWGPRLVGTACLGPPPRAARLWSDPMSRGKMADLLRAIACFDVRHRLREIRPRTLVVHGGRDALLPPAAALELVGRIPGARLAMLERADHFAFLTDRERVLEELRSFWNEEVS